MKKITIVFITILFVLVLSACGNTEKYTDITYTCSQDYGGKKLYFLTWGEYMDRGLIKVFEKKCNAKVIYEETTSNEEFRNKLTSGVTDYDLMTPSDWMVDYLRTNGKLNSLNKENIPNLINIDERFLNIKSSDTNSPINKPTFDPDNNYSVPYFFGTIGIMYNKELLEENGVKPEELNTWNILWDKRLNNQIEIYDSQRDVFMIGLKSLGYSVNTIDTKKIDEAKVKLIQQKEYVYAYGADNIKIDVTNGDVAVGVTFSGDYFDQLFELQDSGTDVANNSPIGYVIPEEGTNLWFDNFIIPKTSKNQRLAEEFINFFLDPIVSFHNTKYVGYSTANKEAFALLKNDEVFGKIVVDPYYFPQDSELKNSEVYNNLDQSILDYITKAYEDIKK